MTHRRLRCLAHTAVLSASCLLGGLARGSANVSKVPTFSESDRVANLDDHEGSEWPDERELESAFQAQFHRFDSCIANEKQRRDIRRRLAGDAEVAVLLNPRGMAPLGVNAAMPRKHRTRTELVSCLRTAVAAAPYPAYDGPPLVVKFEFELDPGFALDGD
ncbi:MAG: hypothetical protein V3V08_20310 [Nannocystaceae bacterium]